jgi:folate-dependent tRNA-U54 methylase TrmFO/GidA
MDAVHVIGGGLAGSEAAWQLAQAGVMVVLHEMRPVRMTEAHQRMKAGCGSTVGSFCTEGNEDADVA